MIHQRDNNFTICVEKIDTPVCEIGTIQDSEGDMITSYSKKALYPEFLNGSRNQRNHSQLLGHRRMGRPAATRFDLANHSYLCGGRPPPDRTIMGEGKSGVTPTKFGTFGGVFKPSTLTILGVIMFLRFGQVVGQNADPDKAESKIQSLIETARVKATPNIARSNDTSSEMRVRSAPAAIVFIGFEVPAEGTKILSCKRYPNMSATCPI